MTPALHVLDAACDGDAVLEAALLAAHQEAGALVCLGAPPETAYSPPPRRPPAGRTIISVSLASRHGSGDQLSRLIAGSGVCCWSASSAQTLAEFLDDCRPALTIRLSAAPVGRNAEILRGLARRHACRLVCTSQRVAREARSAGLENTQVIPPPAEGTGNLALGGVLPVADFARRGDVRRRWRIAADEIVVVAPGQVHRRSGHKLAVWALAILNVMKLPVRLVIQHSGQAARDVLLFAGQAGLGGQTILADGLDLAALLSAADVAAFAAPDSIPGVSLATAMALGRPIAAADTPPARDFLTDGRTALLAEPDSPRALARALLCLLKDKPLAARLGLAAAAAADDFSLPAIRRQWDDRLACR